jgi:hypothetical protein
VGVEAEKVTELTVLGIGADPRMDGYRPVSSLAASENAYEYIAQHPDEPSLFSALLADGDLLGFILELCLTVLFEL